LDIKELFNFIIWSLFFYSPQSLSKHLQSFATIHTCIGL
jgi:hypothetical protein